MQKILFTFLISIVSGIFVSIALIALSVRAFGSVFFGILISDIIMVALYSSDIINNTNNEDLIYITFYIMATIIFLISSGMYTLIRNNSDRCVCKCCARSHYEKIVSSYYQ